MLFLLDFHRGVLVRGMCCWYVMHVEFNKDQQVGMHACCAGMAGCVMTAGGKGKSQAAVGLHAALQVLPR